MSVPDITSDYDVQPMTREAPSGPGGSAAS
jgi:hypothetical protein